MKRLENYQSSYSKGYLMKLTKMELIEQIRILENNINVQELLKQEFIVNKTDVVSKAFEAMQSYEGAKRFAEELKKSSPYFVALQNYLVKKIRTAEFEKGENEKK